MQALTGKVVVITGASGGIGAAVAERAGCKGARLVLAARRRAELEQVAARAGGETLVVVTDVTRRTDVERLVKESLDRFGQIDVLVNNAGRGISRPVSQLSDEDLDDMMRVNVKSALYGMQAVLPHFRERKRGQIVNVSSMLGRLPVVPIRSAYCAAKHALNALSASLRMELRAEYPEIRVTTVLPGVVATDFGKNAVGGGMDSRAIPGAQPVEEVAEVIVEAMERPRPEVYTRPEYQQQVIRYFSTDDLAALEAQAAPLVGRR